MSLNLVTTFDTPKDLAVALLNDSEPDLLFISETIEWMDHFAFDQNFTTRMTDYFVTQLLNSGDFESAEMSAEEHEAFMNNLVRLGVTAQKYLATRAKQQTKETI